MSTLPPSRFLQPPLHRNLWCESVDRGVRTAVVVTVVSPGGQNSTWISEGNQNKFLKKTARTAPKATDINGPSFLKWLLPSLWGRMRGGFFLHHGVQKEPPDATNELLVLWLFPDSKSIGKLDLCKQVGLAAGDGRNRGGRCLKNHDFQKQTSVHIIRVHLLSVYN